MSGAVDGALRSVGVVGAGTMGAGIAQVLAQAGAEVRLIDVDAAATARGERLIEADLARAVQRGRMGEHEAAAVRARVVTGTDVASLAGCELVVEAVPERLELKRDVMRRLAQACGERTILATNTSSLLVSAIAATTPAPERVVGLHFFNPAPAMKLVEVVPGVRTEAGVLARAVAVVEAAGKRPIVARDGIGFVVNRCARPFYGEALKLVAEGVATVEQVDRVCRLGGGFRMGPFELIDLIGVDVNFEIARSFFEQSFGEPRWQPSPLQARLVAAGLNGRKSRRGFYDYADGPHRPEDPELPRGGGGDGRYVAIVGDGPLSELLRARARAAGFSLEPTTTPWLVVDAGPHPFAGFGWEAPCAALCADRSLAARRQRGAAGFHLLADERARLVELTAGDDTAPQALARTQEFFTALGLHAEQVGDAPGLVLGRIVAQLVNEAAFAVAEGVASIDDVDAGMTLGLRHPRGPGEWSRAVGPAHLRAILDGLWEERRDPRYRPAPRA
ncbi:MAG TPA: 3-hydroxyacyl-CoA dehydrogenase NAD-binding domain-containing protein [Conexibacter sp.]|nr:3-hydroxyacyl-CoA dehydrogenase NAD-binding domain-containing protein [Conexibacter sp.]